MFAVIKTGGKQYRVAAEDVLKIEKLAGDAGDMIEFGEVLMVGDGGKSTIGAPLVDGAMVTGEVIETGRARKVISFKKRRRQNSKRTKGHRQWQTTIRISEILTDGAKPSKKAKKAAPAKDKAEKPAAEKKAETKKPEAEKTAKPAAKKEDAPKKQEASAAAPLFKAPAGKGDDLTEIKGIGPVAKTQLNEQGITTFAQIAKLTDKDVARIDEAMPFSADQISDWREQAKEMSK